MAFSDGFLAELKDRVGLIDLVGRRVKLHRRGREASGLCPFHNEKTPSFTVSEDKGFYHCFGCGAHGSAIDFVMQTEGLSFPEAVEKLALEAGLPVPRASPGEVARAAVRGSLYDVLEAAARWFQAELAGGGRAARDYLTGRGLDDATIAAFRLGYAPARRTALKEALIARGHREQQLLEAGLLVTPEGGEPSYDRFRDRVMFPITDRRGRVIAFGGRALGDVQPKYLNSPETPVFHKGRMLYNLAGARQAAHEAGTVLVAEGYMDVIALAQAGFAHAVAPLGTALTEEQMGELWRIAPEPVLCFDGDAAGQRAAERAAARALPLLRPGCSFRFAELPPGLDPDSFLRAQGPQALNPVLEGALPLAEVLWRRETAGRALDTPERRAGLRRNLNQLAGEIGDETVRAYYRDYFEDRLDRAFGRARGVRQGGGRRAAGRGRRMALGAAFENPLSRRHALVRGIPPGGEHLEKTLVALILNHPALLDRVFEEFATADMRSAKLDNLRCWIVEKSSSGAALDLDSLKTTFSERSYSSLIDELTRPQSSRLEPFVWADASLDDALNGWIRTCRWHQLALLEAEKISAEQAFAAEPTDENSERLLRAKAAWLAAEKDATRDNASAGGSGARS